MTHPSTTGASSTTHPTTDPTHPTADPTNDPTSNLTTDPTSVPTINPTTDPTSVLTNNPTTDPTNSPTSDLTSAPISSPSNDRTPSMFPTEYSTDDSTTASLTLHCDDVATIFVSYDGEGSWTNIGQETSWRTPFMYEVTNVSPRTVIGVSCQDNGSRGGFIATIQYNEQNYSTTNPLTESIWDLINSTDNETSPLVYSSKTAGPWGIDTAEISVDAMWIWNGNNLNTMLFEFQFAKIPEFKTTISPTVQPTQNPTVDPTGEPAGVPTSDPTGEPTLNPTKEPTSDPTNAPSMSPTRYPIQYSDFVFNLTALFRITGWTYPQLSFVNNHLQNSFSNITDAVHQGFDADSYLQFQDVVPDISLINNHSLDDLMDGTSSVTGNILLPSTDHGMALQYLIECTDIFLCEHIIDNQTFNRSIFQEFVTQKLNQYFTSTDASTWTLDFIVEDITRSTMNQSASKTEDESSPIAFYVSFVGAIICFCVGIFSLCIIIRKFTAKRAKSHKKNESNLGEVIQNEENMEKNQEPLPPIIQQQEPLPSAPPLIQQPSTIMNVENGGMLLQMNATMSTILIDCRSEQEGVELAIGQIPTPRDTLSEINDFPEIPEMSIASSSNHSNDATSPGNL